MTEYRCSYALNYTVDAFFCFTTTIRLPILQMPHYTEYQYFLYETISKLREKGMTFNQIADHLNKKKILSVRGKQFRSGHIHSIMKRKRVIDEKLKKKFPEARSDFCLNVIISQQCPQKYTKHPERCRKGGGSDGTRTRGLRRDRPAL